MEKTRKMPYYQNPKFLKERGLHFQGLERRTGLIGLTWEAFYMLWYEEAKGLKHHAVMFDKVERPDIQKAKEMEARGLVKILPALKVSLKESEMMEQEQKPIIEGHNKHDFIKSRKGMEEYLAMYCIGWIIDTAHQKLSDALENQTDPAKKKEIAEKVKKIKPVKYWGTKTLYYSGFRPDIYDELQNPDNDFEPIRFPNYMRKLDKKANRKKDIDSDHEFLTRWAKTYSVAKKYAEPRLLLPCERYIEILGLAWRESITD